MDLINEAKILNSILSETSHPAIAGMAYFGITGYRSINLFSRSNIVLIYMSAF
jgi:hypothetical protein